MHPPLVSLRSCLRAATLLWVTRSVAPTDVSYSTLIAHDSFDDGTATDDYGSLDGTINGATATFGRDRSGAHWSSMASLPWGPL